MSEREKRLWRPSGMLSLHPMSFFWMLDPFEPPATESRDGIGIVHVRGPLEHHASAYGYCDTYEGILGRVRAALESKPKALVLAIDSPGGLASGNTEAAREIRAACDAVDVPLVAYCHGVTASAAYALACVAREVVTPPSGVLGSIGTMCELMDVTDGDAQWGVKVHVVSSGTRKLDGNPHVPQTDDRLAEVQKTVDALAGVFFTLVADHRGLSADAIRAMQGAVYVGAGAVTAGLATSVETLPALIARLSGVAPVSEITAPAGAERPTMDEEEKKARAALQAILDDEKSSAKAKSKAKAALAALDEGDDKEGEGAESGGAAAEPESRALAAVAQLRTEIAKDREDRQRETDRANVRAQLDARPDLTAEQRTAFEQLAPKALSEVLATIPRSTRRNPVADLSVKPTRGAHVGGNSSRAAELRSALGIGKQTRGVVNTGTTLRIGAPLAASAAKEG